MCGIVGALAYGNFETKAEERIRQEAMIFFTSELLQLTESRGKDATGLATLFSNCDYMCLKMGVRATEFVSRFGGTETDFAGFLNIWRKNRNLSKIAIGHCRNPSAGVANSINNNNNHPIKAGHIIGVHNGTITNHDKIVENIKYKCDGKVDSEAIFSLIDFYTNKGTEPFSIGMLENVYKRIHGTFTCLAFSTNNPFQMAVLKNGRPVELFVIKPLKIVLMASEEIFIKSAIFRYNRFMKLYKMGMGKSSCIKKSDVDTVIMKDKSVFIFDIRQEITKDTKASDLFITTPITATNKLWGATRWTGGNTYYRGPGFIDNSKSTTNTTNHTNNVVNMKKKVEDNSKTGTAQLDRVGMAWSHKKAKYENISFVKKTINHPHVIMDTKNIQIFDAVDTNIIVKDDTDSTMAKTSSPQKSKELKYPITVVTKTTKQSKNSSVANEQLTQINMNKNPIILEKAVIETAKVINFASDVEVCNKLGIFQPKHLKTMEIYCLANRIKNQFFKNGWYKGYVTCKKDIELVDKNTDIEDVQMELLKKLRIKQLTAHKVIKISKNIIKLLCKLNINCDSHVVNEVVTKSYENGEWFDLTVLKKAFRSNDLNSSPTLKKLIDTIEDLQEKGKIDYNGTQENNNYNIRKNE